MLGAPATRPTRAVPSGGRPARLMSRARRLCTVGGAAALVLLAACGRSDTPETLARRFMDAYYVRADLGAAKGLAAGLASQKIDEEVGLTRGQQVGTATEGREVAYTLVSRQADGDHQRFLYDLRIRLKGSGEFARRSVVSVAQVGGAWRVTNFHESSP